MGFRRPARTGQSVQRTDEEWRGLLTPDQYRVLRGAGTERPFTGVYDDCHDEGTYRCGACDAPVFSSDTKFESGSGWPSFSAPAEGAVVQHRDFGLLGLRTEVRCKACGSHLGHVFGDGPRPTGQRYCINSCALKLDTATHGARPDGPTNPDGPTDESG